MTREFTLEVDGYPPAKNVALSMLGEKHPHRPRVIALLRVAKSVIESTGCPPFSNEPIGLELVLYARPDDRNLGDGPNYIGGVADVLQHKGHLRISLEHLGELRYVALYDDDRHIREIRYQLEPAVDPRYSIRIWVLS